MEVGVTGALGFWWPARVLPHPFVYFQLLRDAFTMVDLCAVLIPPTLSPSAFLRLFAYL